VQELVLRRRWCTAGPVQAFSFIGEPLVQQLPVEFGCGDLSGVVPGRKQAVFVDARDEVEHLRVS